MDDIARRHESQAERVPGEPRPQAGPVSALGLVIFGGSEVLRLEPEQHQQHEEATGDGDPQGLYHLKPRPSAAWLGKLPAVSRRIRPSPCVPCPLFAFPAASASA